MVDAAYNMNHSWSQTTTYSYSAEVAPYTTVHVGYKDWYHVRQFLCHITCQYIDGRQTNYGTGHSDQWYAVGFYSCAT